MATIIQFPPSSRPLQGETLEEYCDRTCLPYSSDNMDYFDKLATEYVLDWDSPIVRRSSPIGLEAAKRSHGEHPGD